MLSSVLVAMAMAAMAPCAGCAGARPAEAPTAASSNSHVPAAADTKKCVRGEVEVCTRECDSGRAQSCAVLGYTFVDGIRVPRDPAKGAEFRKRACGGGEFNACGNLAWQYIHGVGVPEDFAQARAYAERGCRGGDGVACANLRFLMFQPQSATARPAERASAPPAVVFRSVPDNAAAEAAIDGGFKQWSSAWMFDRYIPGSAHAVNRGLRDGTFLVRGMFGFMRGGGRLNIPFAAAFTNSGDGYRLSNLCYNDVSTGTTDCIDPSDGQQVDRSAARSRQFLGSVVLLGLAIAMDGPGGEAPQSSSSASFNFAQYRGAVDQCNSSGINCWRVQTSDMTPERRDAEGRHNY
jgi:hypothetical protein